METPKVDEQFKSALKAAVLEVLHEEPSLLRDLIEETVEDFALARAIEEGAATPLVDRKEVFGVLGGEA